MKKLSKKIGALVLAATLISGSGLSQEVVGYAASVRRTLVGANLLKTHPQGSAYNYVEGNQYRSNYDAIYLGNATKFNKYVKRTYTSGVNMLLIPQHARNSRIPDYYSLQPNHRYFYLEFKDGFNFLSNLHRLDTYRGQNDPIIVKIEQDYFAFFFKLTSHERNVLPIKQLIEPYGFTVEYAHDTSSIWGKAEFDSYIGGKRFEARNDIKNKPKWQIQQLVTKLLKEPNNKEDSSSKNVFSDIEHFAYDLKNNRISIPEGLSRYRIGKYDYLFKKE